MKLRRIFLYFLFGFACIVSMPKVNAATSTLNGTAHFYSQVGDSLTGVGTGYDSSFNASCTLNSTTSYCTLHKADITANKTYFYPVKQIGVVNTNFSYKAQTYYTVRIDFYAVQGQISRTYTQWHVNVDNSITCDANATCNVTWETNNSYYTAVISYYSTSAHTGSLFDLGSVNNANKTLFVNSSTSNAGTIYIRAATITEVDSGDQETINAINNQTTNINNNINNNFDELENRLFEHTPPNMDEVLEDFNDLMISDTPITDLLLLPLHLVQAFYNGINGSCSTINLGEWFDHVMYIPCINLETYLGSTLWGIIDLLFCGFMILNISQLMLHDFDSLSSAEDLFDETYTPLHHKDRRSDRYD